MKLISNDIKWSKIKRFQGKDFSEVEDNRKAFELITVIVAFATYSAILEAIAAGISPVFVKNGKLIRSHPDGSEDVMSDPTLKKGRNYFHHIPTKVFHARKK